VNDNGLRQINSCKPGSEYADNSSHREALYADGNRSRRPLGEPTGDGNAVLYQPCSDFAPRGGAGVRRHRSAFPKRARGGISPDLGLRAYNDNKVPLIRNTGIRRVDAERGQSFHAAKTQSGQSPGSNFA
jgi:hypothetical protein